ncbi:hypothetical protein ACWD6I_32215 [Streptomyces sp. NPDC002454]
MLFGAVDGHASPDALRGELVQGSAGALGYVAFGLLVLGPMSLLSRRPHTHLEGGETAEDAAVDDRPAPTPAATQADAATVQRGTNSHQIPGG